MMKKFDSYKKCCIVSPDCSVADIFDNSWTFIDIKQWMLDRYSIDQDSITSIEFSSVTIFKIKKMDKLKHLFSLFSSAPTWLRHIVALLIGVASAIWLICSCGQTVRVTVKDTPQGVSISTTQSSKDSSGTNISINPNINFK